MFHSFNLDCSQLQYQYSRINRADYISLLLYLSVGVSEKRSLIYLRGDFRTYNKCYMVYSVCVCDLGGGVWRAAE